MRWVIIAALVLACLIAFLIKSGMALHTGEPSAITPGQSVETYPEHLTSTYLQTKQQIREIEKTREEQSAQ